MDKPVLVILAAGMGSRYGGLKQMDPVDAEGHKIIDFSIYDAHKAGFEKVVFIIKKEMEEDFRELVGNPISKYMEVDYVFQELSDVPKDFVIPADRVKPWGTTHAIMRCENAVKGPFMVINADDYYGKDGYKLMYDFLTATDDDDSKYAMVSYELGKTLTEKGSVTRGVCNVDENGNLSHVVETKGLVKTEDGAAYPDESEKLIPIAVDTPVSMNMWGFKPGLFAEFGKAMEEFFAKKVAENPLKAECLIPTEVDALIKAGKVTVKVLTSTDRWFGVTYKEDKPFVMDNIKKLKDAGEYPAKLWP